MPSMDPDELSHVERLKSTQAIEFGSEIGSGLNL